MTYKIENGIELPGRRGGKAAWSAYPFGEMQIGQSFLVTDRKIGPVSAAASAFAKGTTKRFTCRTVKDGVRVWRTE